jgi:hypothetical protein
VNSDKRKKTTPVPLFHLSHGQRGSGVFGSRRLGVKATAVPLNCEGQMFDSEDDS